MVERAAALALLALVACNVTTSIGATADERASTSGTSTADAATTPTSGPSPAESTETPGESGDQGGSAAGEGSTSSSGLDTGFGEDATGFGEDATGFGEDATDSGGPACFPAQFDSFCIACAKVHCCPEFGACADDFECGCALGCLQYPQFPGPCMCAPTDRGMSLGACLATECAFVCPA